MLCEEPYYLMLGVVGVLVLVDEDELETFLPFCCYIGVLAEEEPSIEKEVVKVHG